MIEVCKLVILALLGGMPRFNGVCSGRLEHLHDDSVADAKFTMPDPAQVLVGNANSTRRQPSNRKMNVGRFIGSSWTRGFAKFSCRRHDHIQDAEIVGATHHGGLFVDLNA